MGRTRTFVLTAFCLVQFVGICTTVARAGQTTSPATPPPLIESMYGPDLYRHYCATCHGRDARGNGPAAAALKVPPPDLTVLSRSRKGVFPEADVARVLHGVTGVAAHGSSEMPVWGPIFRALDPSDARVKTRIASLVSYIASIQQK